MFTKATKMQKEAGDSFLGVDTLLAAVLEAKDVADALSEAGVPRAQLEVALRSVRSSSGQKASTGVMLCVQHHCCEI